MWAVLDSAGFKGLDEEESAQPSSEAGYRLVGHGDKVKVHYEADAEMFSHSWEDGASNPDHRGHREGLLRRRFETIMLGAITQTLIAAGVGFTVVQPETDDDPTTLLVHSRAVDRASHRRFP